MNAAWNSAYDTGCTDIDAQHRALFRVHGAAYTASRAGDAPAAAAAIDALVNATREHFAFEEGLMATSHFPGRDTHAEAHRLFMSDLGALAAQVKCNPGSPVVSLWLESRLASWWKRHVKSNDAALAAHLARKVA
jgi:hemerythrin